MEFSIEFDLYLNPDVYDPGSPDYDPFAPDCD
jgi:hypothetical protein